MKTKRLNIILCLFAGVLLVACHKHEPKVLPLSIDLPASYKSDTAAYRFITYYCNSWNAFGKKVDAMYLKAEKWREKDFKMLTEKELLKVVKLDYEYAALWAVQELVIYHMRLEMENVIKRASSQGAAKIAEVQMLLAKYHADLIRAYGDDLKLDKEPVTPVLKKDSLQVEGEKPVGNGV